MTPITCAKKIRNNYVKTSKDFDLRRLFPNLTKELCA